MNSVLVLLNDLNDWKPYYETNSILTVSDYLKRKTGSKESPIFDSLILRNTLQSVAISTFCRIKKISNFVVHKSG